MRSFSSVVFFILVFSQTLRGEDQHTGSDWLSQVPDPTPLSKIHLPGTHNSAALFEPLPSTAKCQELTIKEQLEAGVRFLDIRCRHQRDRFALYHESVPQRQTFGEFLVTLNTFLSDHPSECVLVSIQETSGAKGNTQSFTQTLKTYLAKNPKLWLLNTTLPSLIEARGQALLVRRFRSPKPLGIDATNWRCRGVHSASALLVQDQFKIAKPEEKWTQMKQLWTQAPDHPGKLTLNFTSGYQPGAFGIPNITAISTPINAQLHDRLLEPQCPPPGILVLDFITPELARSIYQLNFAAPSPPLTSP